MYIAILEDDPDQAELMTLWLKSAGHECKYYLTGQSFIEQIEKEPFDLYILDWALPDINGDKVLSWMRETLGWDIPILFMTFRDDGDDVAKILRLGADDYVTKTVKKDMFLARITSLQRRAKVTDIPNKPAKLNEFEIDDSHITRNGKPLKLTPMEFKLAKYLLNNMGQLRTRADLLRNVWGLNTEVSTRTVDLHISRLRKKLSLLPENGWQLEAVSNFGYRLNKTSETSDELAPPH